MTDIRAALDGRLIHRLWRDGMLAQRRHVAPERMEWDTLTADDQALDESIAAGIRAVIASSPESPRLTHGRHCRCTPCAREDWTNPNLAPCGMHGPSCPAVYAPIQPCEDGHDWERRHPGDLASCRRCWAVESDATPAVTSARSDAEPDPTALIAAPTVEALRAELVAKLTSGWDMDPYGMYEIARADLLSDLDALEAAVRADERTRMDAPLAVDAGPEPRHMPVICCRWHAIAGQPR